MRINALACAAALSVLLGGAAYAMDGGADGTAPAGRAGVQDPAARSAKSMECSQKADAQDLHGKPRKRFMRECKHGA
jgi:hypothetical protein